MAARNEVRTGVEVVDDQVGVEGHDLREVCVVYPHGGFVVDRAALAPDLDPLAPARVRLAGQVDPHLFEVGGFQQLADFLHALCLALHVGHRAQLVRVVDGQVLDRLQGSGAARGKRYRKRAGHVIILSHDGRREERGRNHD